MDPAGTEGRMNQKQWIPMEESTIPKKRVIMRMNGLIVVVATSVVTVIGALFGYPIHAALLGAVASVIFVRSIGRSAEEAVLATMATKDASPTEHARVINVVDGLCVVSGDHRPTLRVVDGGYPMAMAAADPDSAGTIVVSTGFCAEMDRVEVEAVMAHLLWRIRTGEIALTTFALALVRWMSRLGLGSAARAMTSRALDERVMLWADIAACQATRYPPALVSALEKTANSTEKFSDMSAAPLWFASPEMTGDDAAAGKPFSSLGVVHPSLSERIAVLKEI